jgi:acyl-[acyl-carrier-protein]-phospholipid O-acyltransferase/long-chain-fatty-acid--[acyl-carrier-protein] ligase
MLSRRFAPLFWCQFFAAFNDNFLRNALVFLILFKAGETGGTALVTLSAGVFIAPFFILSGLGGEIADRYDKARVTQVLKLAEIAADALGALGFVLDSIPILFAALLLFGIFAAIFTPSKYGILPDHLAEAELPAGNALIESATFIAILLGTMAGGFAVSRGGPPVMVALVMAFAVAAWLASLAIPRTGEGAPALVVDWNVARSTARLIRLIWANRPVWRANLMVCWFWTIGAVALSLVPTVIKESFGGVQDAATVALATFTVGIALGSALATWLASGRIILLPTPIAAFVMGGFMLDLAALALSARPPAGPIGIGAFFLSGEGIHASIDFIGIAMAGGLFIVPAFSAVQAWSAPSERARIIGAVNIVSALAIASGTALIALLQLEGATAAHIFLGLGIGNFLVGAVILRFLPTNPLRDFLSILFRAVYGLELRGAENFRKGGPNPIIALNHVTFLDAALALSLLDRPPVFAIDTGMAARWWVRPFLRFTRAIPIDPAKPLGTRTLINAVKAGETLIIFPEGRLTVTGALMKIYDGAGLIADKTGAMVIPVKIAGLEHSLFTRLSREQTRRRLLPKATVTVLEPVRLSVPAELRGRDRRLAAGSALYTIMSDLVFRTTPTGRTIVEAVVAAGREHGPRRIAIEDPIAGRLSYRRLLAAAAVIGDKLAPLAPAGAAVAVMLPNSNAAAVSLLGLISAGRVPAMINFSAGLASILSACRTAEVKALVTSRSFIEKARLGRLVEGIADVVPVVYLENVRSAVTRADRLRGFRRRERMLVARAPDDPAVILFTSGSEGTPKGVVLSHRNILTNAAQGAARIDFGRSDTLFAVLPLFHSFGLTVGLILPLVFGVRVYLYPSPLHYRLIPEAIYGCNATILLGTDTFLAGYARKAHPYDFRSLRYILAGAEPVKETTRRFYAEKFGLRILEGYGTTEAAPALALNTPMYNRFGTVGRLLPGIATRIDKVPGIADGGRLFVRGDNIMLGYLRAERPGVVEPPPDGWYDTGDIVAIDRDGFVTIKGRARRFAKIGGEMVSLAAVEALAAELWPAAASAVTAVDDPRKGQRLVLVTDRSGATRGELVAAARERGIAELMIPAEVVVVDRLPLLGTGKPDNPAIAKLVAERLGPRPPPAA